jgi:hypothetical protein
MKKLLALLVLCSLGCTLIGCSADAKAGSNGVKVEAKPNN